MIVSILFDLACTEGMIALLEAHADSARPDVLRVLRHCKEGLDGDFGRGSQFLTEIQGGSDVPANLVEAVPDAVTDLRVTQAVTSTTTLTATLRWTAPTDAVTTTLRFSLSAHWCTDMTNSSRKVHGEISSMACSASRRRASK